MKRGRSTGIDQFRTGSPRHPARTNEALEFIGGTSLLALLAEDVDNLASSDCGIIFKRPVHRLQTHILGRFPRALRRARLLTEYTRPESSTYPDVSASMPKTCAISACAKNRRTSASRPGGLQRDWITQAYGKELLWSGPACRGPPPRRLAQCRRRRQLPAAPLMTGVLYTKTLAHLICGLSGCNLKVISFMDTMTRNPQRRRSDRFGEILMDNIIARMRVTRHPRIAPEATDASVKRRSVNISEVID